MPIQYVRDYFSHKDTDKGYKDLNESILGQLCGDMQEPPFLLRETI